MPAYVFNLDGSEYRRDERVLRDWTILSTAFCREVLEWLVDGIGDANRPHSALELLTSFLADERLPIKSLFDYGDLVASMAPTGEIDETTWRLYEEVRLAVDPVQDYRMLMSADTFGQLSSDKARLRATIEVWAQARAELLVAEFVPPPVPDEPASPTPPSTAGSSTASDGAAPVDPPPVTNEPLERPDQLPDVPGARVLIDWQLDGRSVVILSAGDTELRRQRLYTNPRSLTTVFELCRSRYGERFAGLRLDGAARDRLARCFAGQEVFDYLMASLETDPTRPVPPFPIDRRTDISSHFALDFTCAPRGLIEVDLIDGTDDIVDHGRTFYVDGSVLLPHLLEAEFGPDPDEQAIAARGEELGFDPNVWQDVAVALFHARSAGRVDEAHAIAQAAGALVARS